ncbi:MAG: dihydrofolate reductase family protein [Candidatus Binatia bacterium]|nr:dihydrofolate reductase family protein [Candidatus Binatia bacterium]
MSSAPVSGRIEELWSADLTGRCGVLHVTAVGRATDGGATVIRIGPESPASETDFFALSVARARSDAIVTTGSILRAELAVSHDPGPALTEWRGSVLGKTKQPMLAILTRGTGLPEAHPVFERPNVLIGTSVESAPELEARLGPRGVAVVGLADSSLRGLLRELARRGLPDICVEAGPSTAGSLYDAPVVVDELLLSVYEEAPLPPALDAGPFLSSAALAERLGPPVSAVSRREASGLWQFRRFCRSRGRTRRS